ncbi:hypothetical protein JNW91_24955 [Micromonospora sp. STR1_7]|uniref:Uncharacterized protein n=1 Tax=Micromonospora parastrephiae TaxID=2806101 RepID=A0ABS1XZT5_9ACTN|nr:hypothetical protein [Micromonospora parastrephiae]MBM0234776.1 hypothetical protein [Micromonospora parastrephiae]
MDTLRPGDTGTVEQASRPVSSAPADTVDGAAATAPVTVGPGYAPAVDPGRGVPSRRGPPTR